MTAVIPHPTGRFPLVGDVIGFSPARIIQDATRDARTLGPIFQRRMLNLTMSFVSGPDLVAELSDERRFTKHLGAGSRILRPLTGDGLITAYNHEPNWRVAHELLMPAFTQAAMRRYHPMMLDVAGQLTGKWDTKSTVDVLADMSRMTLETVGRAGFGYSFESFHRDKPHPFITAMGEALAHGQRALVRLPVLGDLLGRRADQRNAANIAYVNKVVDDVIAARSKGGDNSSDLLGLMLEAGTLDPVNIRYQVINFMVAGTDTTSGALTFALYYLARNPDAMARARSEVDELWADGVPDYEQVIKLRYLRRVVEEGMRLWPPVPGYWREAREDTMLAGRYPMKAGDAVFVLLPALHRHPVWGDDPERFDPDRFLPARVKSRPAHVYKPFGTGERACLGRQFALHEAALVLGTLVRRYDLAVVPGYQLKVREALTLRTVDFRLAVSRR